MSTKMNDDDMCKTNLGQIWIVDFEMNGLAIAIQQWIPIVQTEGLEKIL